MSDYTSRSKEYQAQEEANRRRQAAEAKAGAAMAAERNKQYTAAEKAKRAELDQAEKDTKARQQKMYGGGRYRQPRRALGILNDAKRLLRI